VGRELAYLGRRPLATLVCCLALSTPTSALQPTQQSARLTSTNESTLAMLPKRRRPRWTPPRRALQPRRRRRLPPTARRGSCRLVSLLRRSCWDLCSRGLLLVHAIQNFWRPSHRLALPPCGALHGKGAAGGGARRGRCRCCSPAIGGGAAAGPRPACALLCCVAPHPAGACCTGRHTKSKTLHPVGLQPGSMSHCCSQSCSATARPRQEPWQPQRPRLQIWRCAGSAILIRVCRRACDDQAGSSCSTQLGPLPGRAAAPEPDESAAIPRVPCIPGSPAGMMPPTPWLI
jgi:hypothetical protein